MKRLKARRRVSAHMAGFAILEVLVALLIFMFGVLGMVGLQGSMTRIETESKIRADAANLAREAISTLWTADLGNLANYNGSACDDEPRCKEWQDKVMAALPDGSGSLDVDSGTGDVTITIQWKLPDGQTHKYATSTTISKREGV